MRSLFAALALLAVPAVAQAQQQLQQPPDPCRRGASRMMLAGTDLDTMRCQLSTAVDQVVDLTGKNMTLTVQLRMAQSDLKAASERASAAEKANAKPEASAVAPAAAAPAPASAPQP